MMAKDGPLGWRADSAKERRQTIEDEINHDNQMSYVRLTAALKLEPALPIALSKDFVAGSIPLHVYQLQFSDQDVLRFGKR